MGRSTFVGLSLVLLGMISSQTVRAQDFLLIQTDVRSRGMGEVIAAVPDNPAGFISNPALLPFAKTAFASASYAKWLPNVFDDMHVYSVNGGISLQSIGTFGAGALLLIYGPVQYTGEQGEDLGEARPFDLSLFAGYGISICRNLAVGGVAKLVYSDQGKTRGEGRERGDPTAATIGFDLGVLVPALFPMLTITGDRFDFKDHPSGFARFAKRFSNNRQHGISVAMVVQNIGPDLKYNSRAHEPLPRNLKVGFAYRVLDSDPLGWIVAADANRLLTSMVKLGTFVDEVDFNLGTEITVFRLFDIRVGYITDCSERLYPYVTYGFAVGVDQLKFEFSNRQDPDCIGLPSPWDTKSFGCSLAF